jgi:hypothetical protein
VPPAHLAEFEAPGFKVLHIQDIDYRTNCETFIECLQKLLAVGSSRRWRWMQVRRLRGRHTSRPSARLVTSVVQRISFA